MNVKIVIYIIILLIGIALGSFSIAPFKAAQPPLQWSTVLVMFLGASFGLSLLIGLQSFRKDPSVLKWAISLFSAIAFFNLGSGVYSVVTNIISSEPSPHSFALLGISIGMFIAIFISKGILHAKFK